MTFELRKNIAQYFLFLFIGSIVAMVAMAVIIIRQHEGQEMGWDAIAAMTMIGVILSIPLVLTTDYFLEDFSKSILVENDTITVEKNSKKLTFNKCDIAHLYFVFTDIGSYGSIIRDFKYFVIVLKNGEFVYATNLICNPRKFIHEIGLPAEEIIVSFPYIDKAIGRGDLS